jgi:thiol-disulfide isomerase/thioredoxin
MTRGVYAAGAALAALTLLAACGEEAAIPAPPQLQSRVDVDTPELRAEKKRIGVEECALPDGPGSDLPGLTLPCLGGGEDLTLSDVSGPAVVQLWASWCVSCPDELPLFQRLADEHGPAVGGELTVFGIDWQDTQPGKAMALLDHTETTMPQWADPGGDLADHYRLNALPAVLLVDADGAVTFKLMRIDTYAQLADLVTEHTGVPVTAG